MGAAARKERGKNFEMPTVAELQEMRTLESEREARRMSRAQRQSNREQFEINQAGICANIVIQLPAAIDSNKTLIRKAHAFLEPYLDRALARFNEPPEADDATPEPEPEPEPKTATK